MIINNVELEFDIFEASVAEKYEKAIDHVIKEAQESKGLKMSVSIKKQCKAVFDCFDTIFGPGTYIKIFGNSTNLVKCLNAFAELQEEVTKQSNGIDSIVGKYSPNRAQKRAKK